MWQRINETPLLFYLLFAFTLGLAPFAPPHLVEKIGMLLEGGLNRPVDIFDLLMHAFPWLLLSLKLLAMTRQRGATRGD